MGTQYMEYGYEKAVELLKACSTDSGFVASPVDKANYKRIWGRDGIILGLAALLTEDSELISCFKKTLKTLAHYQGPHGEIPSNVDTLSERISYGGMTGRVDADLWFIIGCGEYWSYTGDDDFLNELLPMIEKTRFLLECWEFNNRGFIYIPETGDWADEYIHNGYILYDQLLYLQVKLTINRIRYYLNQSVDHVFQDSILRLTSMIKSNYWFNDSEKDKMIYHEILHEKGLKAASQRDGVYWMPFFSPHGYGYRFDSLSNIFASLFGVADEQQSSHVDEYIESIISDNDIKLLPAFHPVIQPVNRDWKDLKMTFSYTFKNKPYEYHNGGLWPMITGFYVADLMKRGKKDKAREYIEEIHKANYGLNTNEENWIFPEYINGNSFLPSGTKNQGWSGAGAVIAHHSLDGKKIFRITKDSMHQS